MSTITFSPELRRALGASVFYGTPAAAGAAAATFKSYVDPDAPNVDIAISGVYNADEELVAFQAAPYTGLRITSTDNNTAATVPITHELLGQPATYSIGSTSGNWTVLLPFDIQYLGQTYSTIYVNMGSYVTFGVSSDANSDFSATQPLMPKIFISALDGYGFKLYQETTGSTPNRKHRLRYEGTYQSNGAGGTTRVWEMTFYENTPNQFDLQFGMWASTSNSATTVTPSQLRLMKGTVPANFSTLTNSSSRSSDILASWDSSAFNWGVADAVSSLNTEYAVASQSGTATWFWWYQPKTTNAGSDIVWQIVGTVGTTGTDLVLSNTTVVS